MESKAVNFKRVFILAGAICAYWIGAGFSTGQEVLQFFGVHGYNGLLGAGVCFVLNSIFSVILWNAGKRENFSNPYDVFPYYCGKYLGQLYIWFCVILCYGIFVVMMAGGGATVNQYYGVPVYLGTGVLGILALLTIMLGIKKLINFIGFIGPVKILFLFIIGVAALAAALSNWDLVASGDGAIASLGFKAVSGSWFWSGCLFAFLTVMMSTTFQISCGQQASNRREARIAAIIGSFALCLAVVFVVFAEMTYHEIIAGRQVPTLAIANYLSPVFAALFSMIIVVCIYSAVSSTLLMVVRKFAVDKTKKFNIIALILTAIGVFFSSVIPFDKLVNFMLPLTGYAAILFSVLMFIKEIKLKNASKKASLSEEDNGHSPRVDDLAHKF